MDTSKISLQDFRLEKAPDTLFYIPNFISAEEEEFLLDQINGAPKPKWRTLNNRRLQNWGGIVGKRALIPDNDIPEWLQCFMTKVSSISSIFPPENLPNHVLINEYLPGQGIMPHEDGPAFYPTVTTISLDSHSVLEFYRPITEQQASLPDRLAGSVLLEPRSLIIVRDQLYDYYLHGISERTHDTVDERMYNADGLGKQSIKLGDRLERGTRVSVTIRNVPKVAKLGVMDLIKK